MGSGTALAIVKALELLSLALTVGPQAYSQAQQAVAKLREMVEQGRDPTTEEMAAIDQEIAALRSVLHKPI